MAGGRDRWGLGLRLGAALGAGVVLALAAASLHAARGSALAGTGPLHGHWVLVLAVVAGLGWLMVSRQRRRQDSEQVAPALETRLDSMVVPGIAMMAVVTAVTLAVLGLHSPGAELPPAPQPTVTAEPTPTSVPPPTGGPAVQPQPQPHQGALPLSTLLLVFGWILGLAALVTLIVLGARWLGVRRGGDAQGIDGGVDGGAEDALAEAVSAGQQALADDGDARAAIIACYAAMETSLADGGLSRMKADTPAELLDRAVAAGLVPDEAAHSLTDLFREARYSTHPMSEHQRERARAALDAIAAHLAAATAGAADRFGPLVEEQQV
ncbi:DUF4129 domain-containing protein [Streptacidiphilus rugosus]|uniref:DUF4129 domain-containing protein n=1 Tax=Streptacidiphilus rugosus TaxID=405783 RepID=UPI00068DC016|nr:DUF4129 domain-containing protein [Streptacidiphilus rugosus]